LFEDQDGGEDEGESWRAVTANSRLSRSTAMHAKEKREAQRPRVIVIGGGGTGGAILHDLTLRGFDAVLVERGWLTSGTTGRHHGQLHSGARYAVNDPESALECVEENGILRRIARPALELNDGLFVAVSDEEEAFCGRFLESCRACGIRTRRLNAEEALAAEPNLNPGVRLAVQVPDGTMDAWRLPMMFFATARSHGADIRTFTEVLGLESRAGRVTGVRVMDRRVEREYTLEADLVVNAAGPWAGRVAQMAGTRVPIQATPGVMVAVRGRLVNTVVNRLSLPGDADIVVPQRDLSVVGTSSWFVERPEEALHCPEGHIDKMLEVGSELVPAIRRVPVKAAWVAVRPLIGHKREQGGRGMSRAFRCYDHLAEDGLDGLVSVAGGKATTLRAMAEEAVDLVCGKMGLDIPCPTRDKVLLPHHAFFGGG
jgi:glycerol-3-phosphate dehydrogenase